MKSSANAAKGGGRWVWVFFALLSAVFAAFTTILAKLGLAGVPSNLATAIRTGVVLLMSWLVVFVSGQQDSLGQISGKTWLFLVLSGIATGLSWLCYFYALQVGNANQVAAVDKFSLVITMILAFVLLQEKVTWQSVVGGSLITAGTIVLIL